MHGRKGFSLAETAVILGIVGSVMGGIWVMAAASRASMQANQLHQQTLNLIKNVRDYYAGRPLPTVGGPLTATLRTASVFPEELCPANCVDGTITTVYNAYGGAINAHVENIVAPINSVMLTYYLVPAKGCLELGMKLSARAAEIGLTSYDGGGTNYTSFPIELSALEADCASRDAEEGLILRFRIRN